MKTLLTVHSFSLILLNCVWKRFHRHTAQTCFILKLRSEFKDIWEDYIGKFIRSTGQLMISPAKFCFESVIHFRLVQIRYFSCWVMCQAASVVSLW